MPRRPNSNKEHFNDPFPTALRKLIEETGVVQDELTKVLGVKYRQSITGYIDGSTAPTPKKINAVADFFGCDTDYLLGRIEQKRHETNDLCEMEDSKHPFLINCRKCGKDKVKVIAWDYRDLELRCECCGKTVFCPIYVSGKEDE